MTPRKPPHRPPASHRHCASTHLLGLCIILLALLRLPTRAAEDSWPPAPPLPAAAAVEDSGRLPASVRATPAGDGQWQTTFRFLPPGEARTVTVVGSFNNWDRQAHALAAGADGEWSVTLAIPTGVHEYKFLVNGTDWFEDPANDDRVPDGFGGHNSRLRLGRLARLTVSPARIGDGDIDSVGLEHQPPLPLYIQPLGLDRALLRYRTLSHDVAGVSLALRGGARTPLSPVSIGPLFTYWEGVIAVPARDNPRSPGVRSIEYTFVLEDGATVASDPNTYRFSFTQAGLFETPEWARHAVWYQIVLDRFRNGNPANDPQPVRPWTSEWFTPSEWEGKDGQTFYRFFAFDRYYGGDLDGLEQQLPYLKTLGVNALYLNPIFKAPSPHKYDVQNYLHVDDHFGTRGDYERVAAAEDLLDPKTWQWTETDRRFLAFIRTAHAQGFKIILDGVFNHVGHQHPAFLDVQKHGRQSRFADWFEVTSWEPFAYKGWADFAHMPVFRKDRSGFASPAVKQHIFAVTRRWMDPDGDGDPSDGIDGWRLDVANDIPRPFWEEWRRYVKQINPNALITGEIWHRADSWLDGNHFDSVTNYPFARIVVRWLFDQTRKSSVSQAVAQLTELRLAYPAPATYSLLNLLGSHDTDRLASMAANPDREYDRQNRVQDNNPHYNNAKPAPEAYAKARLAALLQMTYVGAPLIYYGDEVGMWGADDPTNRKPMLWKDLEPYEKPEENHVMDAQLDFYRRAIALRNDHPALRIGTLETLVCDDAADVWAFARSSPDERLIVVLNASGHPRTVQVPMPTDAPRLWRLVFGDPAAVPGGAATVSDGILTVQVPPCSGVVLHTPTR